MGTTDTLLRSGYDFYHIPQPQNNLVAEIVHGLSQPKKTINPKFFYDLRGSMLYEKITQTDDYYLTRAETEILIKQRLSIAALVGRHTAIIEPGAGNCRKIEILMDELRPDVYVPMDVSSAVLDTACARLTENYLWLDCIGVVADFNQLEYIAELLPSRRKVAFFPGSTLGNLEPLSAIQFLEQLRSIVGAKGGILIGVDNVKDEAVLNRAYNDSQGITAAFNKNVLSRLNRIAGGNFHPENFSHYAFFNKNLSRIEMHLVSAVDQLVKIGGTTVSFTRGETIHTENSYKYSKASFTALAADAGLQCIKTWTDSQNRFTLYYLAEDHDSKILH